MDKKRINHNARREQKQTRCIFTKVSQVRELHVKPGTNFIGRSNESFVTAVCITVARLPSTLLITFLNREIPLYLAASKTFPNSAEKRKDFHRLSIHPSVFRGKPNI